MNSILHAILFYISFQYGKCENLRSSQPSVVSVPTENTDYIGYPIYQPQPQLSSSISISSHNDRLRYDVIAPERTFFTPTPHPTMPHRNNSIHHVSNNDMLFFYICILPIIGVITLTIFYICICICRKIQQNPVQNPVQNPIQIV